MLYSDGIKYIIALIYTKKIFGLDVTVGTQIYHFTRIYVYFSNVF